MGLAISVVECLCSPADGGMQESVTTKGTTTQRVTSFSSVPWEFTAGESFHREAVCCADPTWAARL